MQVRAWHFGAHTPGSNPLIRPSGTFSQWEKAMEPQQRCELIEEWRRWREGGPANGTKRGCGYFAAASSIRFLRTAAASPW